MGKGGGSPPPPPDPQKEAEAQFQLNKDTAGWAIAHGTPNQTSPAGFVNYNKYDLPNRADGSSGGQGVSNVTTGFTPEFQDIFDQIRQTGEQRVNNLPTGAFNPTTDTTALQQSYIDEGVRNVMPVWETEDKQRKVLMAERGIPIDSEIWNGQQDQAQRQRYDYLAGLGNQAHQAAADDQARQYQQEVTTRQVADTEFANTQNMAQSALAALQGRDSPVIPASITAPDRLGAGQRAYQSQLQAWQAQQASKSAGLGGLMSGLGALGGLFSDERVKDDIDPVGKTDDGQTIYRYRYKGDPTFHMGLLAQEVEKRHPEAVGEVGGIKTVNYQAATEGAIHHKGKPSLASHLRHGGQRA